MKHKPVVMGDAGVTTEMTVDETNASRLSEPNSSMRHLSLPGSADMTWDDATWILTSSFIIFTMQSGMFFKYTIIYIENTILFC